ncbi:ATP-binding cassette domain-containing protein [Reticulibacter mediterranei]|uniref:ATP-binding cassette domain-containing protein n=1 Tax=Reticulibacter mediterranei TaxID=2778369 RepID=UPI001C68B865|nr:ABC transporter ATP-binding protein [Reticulibacter mediterranei]
MIPIWLVSVLVAALLVIVGLWLDNRRQTRKETSLDLAESGKEEKRSRLKKFIGIPGRMWRGLCRLGHICSLLAHPARAEKEQGTLRLLPFFLTEKRQILKAFILVSLTACLTLIFGMLMRQLPLVVKDGPQQVVQVAGLAILVICLNELANLLAQQIMVRWSANVVENINEAATRSALDARYEVHLHADTAEVVNGSQPTQREWLMNSLNFGAFTLLSSLVTLIASIVICLFTNWLITLVVLALLVLCSLQIVRVGQIRGELYKLRRKVLGEESVALNDAYSMSGIQDRKTGGKDFLPQISGYAHEWKKASVRTICLARTAYVPTSIVVGSLSPLLFLVMALTGGMSLTGILAMLAQLSIMASKLAGVTSGFQFAQDLRNSAQGFAMMLRLEPELAPTDDAVLAPFDPRNRTIRVRGVKFMYRGTEDFVITEASCEIEPGFLVSVIGPSGEGKSTFAQILAGLLHPQQGEIWCGGHFLHALTAEVRNGLVAYMGQFAPAFHGTVREVFRDRWGDASDAEIKQVLTTTSLWTELRKKQGLKTEASSLSGGQRQRLHFALIDFEIRREGPKIVIIDEGTSDLDLASERKIVARLRVMAQEGCTVLQVAHRVAAINVGTHIFAMENGVGSLMSMSEACADQESLYYRLVVSTGATKV